MPAVNRKAPNATHTQSVAFEKDKWTVRESRKWIDDHNYYSDGMDETDTQYRYRQYDPDETRFNYRIQVLVKNSLSLILGFLKR